MSQNTAATSDLTGRKKTRKKLLLGIGISIITLALGGWLLFRLHFSWLSLEENQPYAVTWQEEAVYVDFMGMFDLIFLTTEPTAYMGNERIALRDGVRIRNGRPYLSMRDFMALDEGVNGTLNVIGNADGSAPVGVIINGLYNQGTEEQNEMIRALLGEQAREKFEVYFQWYNSVHELGHLITVHHGTYDTADMSKRHMVEEEILVNSFAVAFWTHYGEEEKIEALEAMVDHVLSNITPPVDNMSHFDFMRAAVDENRMHEVFTFEIYGWFQFSMVRDLLRQRDTLDLSAILSEMTGKDIQAQPHERLVYPALGTEMVPEIIADVCDVLYGWGITLPDIYIAYSTDPNMHALMYPFTRAVLEKNIAEGRVAAAYR